MSRGCLPKWSPLLHLPFYPYLKRFWAIGMDYNISVSTSSASTHNSNLLESAEGTSGERQFGVRIGEDIKVLQGDDQERARSVPVGDPEDHASLEKTEEVMRPPKARPGRGVGG